MERLSLANGKAFKNLLKTAEKAFKQLHKNEGYKPEDLKTEKVYQDLLEQTFSVFDSAIQDNVVPEVMKTALQSDAFMVAGLKTHAQLFEASTVLMKPDGSVRSYASLENELNKLNVRYNATYLESEYLFAVGSSQMASKWNDFDDDDNYNLQYRTAKDDRVRDSHAVLADITLPKNDPFWDSFYPQNGWRCRCTVVEVAADKYTPSNSKEAIAKGEKATTEIGKNGKNRLELFRFNAGKEQKLFPPKHPYNKVIGADVVKEVIKKETEYKNISVDQLKEIYGKQKIDIDLQKNIMSANGYVATSNAFSINEKLRNKKELSDNDKLTVSSLDSLIKTNKLKDNVLLHRNVKTDFVKNTFGVDIDNLSVSESISKIQSTGIKNYSDKGFTSTSSVKEVNAFLSRKVNLEIRTAKDTNAFVVNNFSESEIILGRNQKFKIVDVVESDDKKKIKIILETDN